MLCFSSAPRKLQVHKCFRMQFIQYCNMICFTPFRRLTVKSHRLRLRTIQNITAKSYPVFEISKIEIKTDECAQEISSYFICFTQQMKVIISCGKSDILKSKQVVSLAKRIFNKFFHCLQSSPPASTRSLQLPFVSGRVTIGRFLGLQYLQPFLKKANLKNSLEYNVQCFFSGPFSQLCIKTILSLKYFCSFISWIKMILISEKSNTSQRE